MDVKMELYRKEQNKWVYYSFDGAEEIDIACLGVQFADADAYEGIDPAEDFPSENEDL
jgi:hypothetical protein